MKTITRLLFLCFAFLQGQAQDENLQSRFADTTYQFVKSMLLTGVETSTTSFIDNTTKDSSGTAPYVSAYLAYYNKSGFGVRAKTYLLTKGDNSGFYLTSLSAYYATYTKKLMPLLSYTRYLQHNNPSVPYSPISNELYGHLRYALRFIEPVIGVDLGFGNDEQNNNEPVTDFNAFAGVGRWFTWQWQHQQALALAPTLQLNAGTDRYFRYLQTTKYVSQNRSLMSLTQGRSGGGRGRAGNGTTTTETYTVSEVNEFALSNVEVNAYLQYTIKRFSLAPSGSLYFPLRGDDKTPYGYWQLNINFTIY